MASCLIDVRCLQDPGYTAHGIGRHARSLLDHAPGMAPGMQLVALADPDLPGLDADVARLFHQVRSSAYTGAMRGPCLHVQLSPMTHDPLFVARLLDHPAIPAATVVHGLTALDEHRHDRPGTPARLDHLNRLRWLARHQLFLPSSEATATRLAEVLSVPPGRIATTGLAGDPSSADVAAGPGSFGLPDCVERAHSPAAAMQQARSVADRFWAAVQRLIPVQAPSIARARPRIAVMTPLPPDRTGVAEYGAPMCAALAARSELHVFTPTQDAALPDGAASIGALSVLPYTSARFDRVVNVMGNSMPHLATLTLLLRHGGAVIQHDGRMLDLYAGQMGAERTAQMAEAELGRALRPNEFWHWLANDFASEARILAEIAAAAEPLLMHSKAAAAEVAERFGKPLIHLPFCPYRTFPDDALTPSARRAVRARLGVTPGTVLLATFGHLHPAKSPRECLWALDQLRGWGIDAKLHFVGMPSMPTEPLAQLADRLGLRPHLRISSSYLAEHEYRDYLVGADVALQLHVGNAGAVSGALSDCIAAGLPTVASATLVAALDAPAYVRAVTDVTSPLLVAEAAAALAAEPRDPEMQRSYVAAHGFDRYAAELCAALHLS